MRDTNVCNVLHCTEGKHHSKYLYIYTLVNKRMHCFAIDEHVPGGAGDGWIHVIRAVPLWKSDVDNWNREWRR